MLLVEAGTKHKVSTEILVGIGERFDDVRLAHYMDPPLTTVRLPAYELGYGAATLLAELIGGGPVEEQEILLQTALVVWQSCGAANQAESRFSLASCLVMCYNYKDLCPIA